MFCRPISSVIFKIECLHIPIISSLVIVLKHSLIHLSPSFFFKFVTSLLECFQTFFFSKWNKSSIGANYGQYWAKNTICHPIRLRCISQAFDQWIGLLSMIMTNLSFSIFKSSYSQFINFVTYSLKTWELFVDYSL